jgi:hypothetical protein
VSLPEGESEARKDTLCEACFFGCSEFGQTEEPANRARFSALKEELRARRR